MIITLKGATFTNNIGALDAWPIQTVVNGGVLTTLPSSSSIKKEDTAGVVLEYFYDNTKYTCDTVTIFSKGSSVGSYNRFLEQGKIQVTIPAGNTLSAKVVVTINLTAIGGGGGEPDTPTNYTFTLNPTPTSATVTLSASGYSMVSGTGSKSIIVADGTTVAWSVSASGYTTRTGNWTINGGNKTENIVLVKTGDSGEVSFSDDDFEIGAWTAAGAPVELDSRFRTKTTKQFDRDVTFNAVTLPNTSGPTSLRFISNGTQTNWINDSYTVPANTEFHLILARAGQTGAVDITRSVTVPEGATKLYVNSLKDQKNNAFAIVNGVTYSGSDFVDKLYHYGEKGAAMSTLTSSSKAASHQNPIAVTAGDTITIRTFTNGTLGYVFIDDNNTIIAVGASTEFMSEYFTPTDYFTYE